MIELLEYRVAPATLTGQVLTYQDVDGDRVAITISKGTLSDSMFTFDTGSVDGDNSVKQQLRMINVSAAAGIDGADITMKVIRARGGDGQAAVGRIDGGLHDLGRVILRGDLGGITCGDSNAATGPGLELLSVRSIGLYGTNTQGIGGDLFSAVGGSFGALKVSGDIRDASIGARNFADRPDGKIGRVMIGGSLIGNDIFSGFLFSTGDIGAVTIKRNLVGGFGDNSGRIDCDGNLGPVRIGGDILGGAGDDSGSIRSADAMGMVRIGGDIVGGAATFSGRVFSGAAMGDVRVGGNVLGAAGFGTGIVSLGPMGDVRISGGLYGGSGGESGRIHSFSTMGNVRIRGDITGGLGNDAGQLESSGAMGNVFIGGSIIGGDGERSGIRTFGVIASVRIGGDLIGEGGASGLVSGSGGIGRVLIGGDVIGASVSGSASAGDTGVISSFSGSIASVTIGGSLIAGSDDSSGSLGRSGCILARKDIGPVKIGGSIIGNATNPALIIATGQNVKPDSGFDTAIASITVGGDVRYARILAGFDPVQAPANADASIGKVTVGGNWEASSLVAGAQDSGMDGFGVNDTLQTIGNTELIARIASITIRGSVTGSLAIADNYGFVAQQIDKLKIGTRTFPLAPGPSSPADNIPLPFTNDVHLLEVS